MSEPVPHVVNRVSLFDVRHSVDDTVAECMWGHVVGITASTVDEVGLGPSRCRCLGDKIPATSGHSPSRGSEMVTTVPVVPFSLNRTLPPSRPVPRLIIQSPSPLPW